MTLLTRSLLLCLAALPLGACCSFTEPSSAARTQQLKQAHLAFIDNHTRSATRKPWVAADFTQEVQQIDAKFDAAIGSESASCPARMQFVKTSKELFDSNAAFVKKMCEEDGQHADVLSPTYAQKKKAQVAKNYELLTH